MTANEYSMLVDTLILIGVLVNTFGIQLPWYIDHLDSKKDDKHEH